MKKLITLFALVFTSHLLSAQYKGEKPFIVKNFASTEIKNLNVKTSGGEIIVEGGYESNSVVEVYVRSSNWSNKIDKEEIENRLKEYDLSITQNGNTIECIAKNKNQNMNWKKGLSITFKIFTPKNINTELNTSGGGIDLKNLNGNLNFKTSGGGLELASLSGKIVGKTSGGGINLSDCSDTVDLTTSGGGISAKNSSGNILLRTSGGGLNLANLKGKINATSSGGGIDAEHISGELITSTSGGAIDLDDVAGNIKASTSGGSIRANISSIDDYLSLSTSAGNINIDMPMSKGMDLDISANRISHNSLNNFNGEVDKDRIVGKMNGGGAKVKIYASSGNVNINK